MMLNWWFNHKSPYKGALTVHDLNVHLPYEWPETEGEMNWFYDFVIYPGERYILRIPT